MSREYVKNKKTLVHVGSGVPATATLAAAVTAADTGFSCLIETMNGIELTRGTTDDPTVYCSAAESFKHRDTDELEISNFVIEGMVDVDAGSGYAAVIALADAMIKADTRGTMVITEPNGTDKLWFEIKLVSAAKMRGGAQDKQKFKIEAIPMTLPAAA